MEEQVIGTLMMSKKERNIIRPSDEVLEQAYQLAMSVYTDTMSGLFEKSKSYSRPSQESVEYLLDSDEGTVALSYDYGKGELDVYIFHPEFIDKDGHFKNHVALSSIQIEHRKHYPSFDAVMNVLYDVTEVPIPEMGGWSESGDSRSSRVLYLSDEHLALFKSRMKNIIDLTSL